MPLRLLRGGGETYGAWLLVCSPAPFTSWQATVLVLEPPNSGTAIVDRLGYLLQEEEFPNERYTPKDLQDLRSHQIQLLRHAFAFQSLEHIVYITRSGHREENEDVVRECLLRFGAAWELSCCLPNIASASTSIEAEGGAEAQEGAEYAECLKVAPSDLDGNGIFVACFSKKPTPALTHAEEGAVSVNVSVATLVQGPHRPRRRGEAGEGKAKRPMRRTVWGPPPRGFGSSVRLYTPLPLARPAATPFKSRLCKSLRQSVERLSHPKLGGSELKADSGSDVNPSQIPPAHGAQDRASKSIATAALESIHLLEAEAEVEGMGGGKPRTESTLDFSLMGQALRDFYAPGHEAMAQLKGSRMEVPGWKYPVPNPRVWK